MKIATLMILVAGAMVIAAGPAAAQRPENIRPAVLITTTPPPPPNLPRSTPANVIDRLMSFDADKDHRISRGELPERMQGLIARGDRNGDAILDGDEVRALVNAASSERIHVAFRVQPSEGLQGVISDLKLPAEKRAQALAIVGAHPPVRRGNETIGSDLYMAMRSLLDDEEYENFVVAATRLSRTARTSMGTIGGVVGGLPPK